MSKPCENLRQILYEIIGEADQEVIIMQDVEALPKKTCGVVVWDRMVEIIENKLNEVLGESQ